MRSTSREEESACQPLKAGARSSILRVTTCEAPRTFERLLIKERRKPRFIKAGARSSILRVQRYTISMIMPKK